MIDRRASLLFAGCAIFAAIIVGELDAGGIGNTVTAQRQIPRAAARVAHRARPAPLDALLATILARPLFSPTRRPAKSGGQDASAIISKRLAGIVIEAHRRLAIFAVAGARSLILTEGEAVDGWRVEHITPQQVSLKGSSGIEVLRPRLDPNLAPPPPYQPAANRGVPAQPPRATATARRSVAPARALPATTTPRVPALLRPGILGRRR